MPTYIYKCPKCEATEEISVITVKDIDNINMTCDCGKQMKRIPAPFDFKFAQMSHH